MKKELDTKLEASYAILKFIHAYPINFIEQVWADEPRLRDHYESKWRSSKGGYDGIMRFIGELDDKARKKLFTWIFNK